MPRPWPCGRNWRGPLPKTIPLDLAYLTALRKSDILHLRPGDIQDNLLVVQTSKTGKKQAFEITPELRDVHFHYIRAKSLTDVNRAAGCDYAQALAGHADGSMTEVYVRARDTQTVKSLGGVVERKQVVEKATSKK